MENAPFVHIRKKDKHEAQFLYTHTVPKLIAYMLK